MVTFTVLLIFKQNSNNGLSGPDVKSGRESHENNFAAVGVK